MSYLKSAQRKRNVEEFKPYYIINMVYAKATEDTIKEIASMDEVKQIYYDEKIYLINDDFNKTKEAETQAASPSDIECNIKQINADDVWNDYNIDGTGAVVATISTPAIYNAIGKYVDDIPITPEKILKALGKV